MYELLVYTHFAVLRDTNISLSKLIDLGESHSYAKEWFIYLDGAEVYHHINLPDSLETREAHL